MEDNDDVKIYYNVSYGPNNIKEEYYYIEGFDRDTQYDEYIHDKDGNIIDIIKPIVLPARYQEFFPRNVLGMDTKIGTHYSMETYLFNLYQAICIKRFFSIIKRLQLTDTTKTFNTYIKFLIIKKLLFKKFYPKQRKLINYLFRRAYKSKLALFRGMNDDNIDVYDMSDIYLEYTYEKSLPVFDYIKKISNSIIEYNQWLEAQITYQKEYHIANKNLLVFTDIEKYPLIDLPRALVSWEIVYDILRTTQDKILIITHFPMEKPLPSNFDIITKWNPSIIPHYNIIFVTNLNLPNHFVAIKQASSLGKLTIAFHGADINPSLVHYPILINPNLPEITSYFFYVLYYIFQKAKNEPIKKAMSSHLTLHNLHDEIIPYQPQIKINNLISHYPLNDTTIINDTTDTTIINNTTTPTI